MDGWWKWSGGFGIKGEKGNLYGAGIDRRSTV